MVKKLRKSDFFKKKKPLKEKSEPKETREEEKPVHKPAVRKAPEKKTEEPKKDEKPKNIKEFYEKKYKLLMIIPVLMLVLAIGQIAFQTIQTGDFVSKGISLSGGISLTVYSDKDVDIEDLQTRLSADYAQNDINVRILSNPGAEDIGFIIEADLDSNNPDKIEGFIDKVSEYHPMTKEDYSLEVMGSSLGESFFRETFTALIIAFTFMGIVVFIMFRTFAPSAAVIVAAFSDIVVTLAIFNVIGGKLSTAGVAAFLMLIGYSVDTDILLSTKVLKGKHGNLNSRIYEAMKTGLTMNITTLIAITLALIFADSETIRQIMSILIIGLLVDIINTWIQNVGFLRLYLEK